jgi:uncharacterized protein YdeI (YjbR/CyaY-like superfamily)
MNPKVDEYLRRAKKWQEEFETLRRIILDCQLTEELKWGKPCGAIEAEKAGLKVEFKKKPGPIPEELQNKLDKIAALKAAFDALTPGRQRAYILYFSAAKQSQTRESRVEKCMQQILKGKGLND